MAVGAAAPNYGRLATIPIESLLERIERGEYTSRIAAELGFDDSALYKWLHKYHYDEYQAARARAIERRLEAAEEGIEQAHDQFSLARARESFRATAWRAEREHPHRWGQRNQVTVTQAQRPLERSQLLRAIAELERQLVVSEQHAAPLLADSVEVDNLA